MLQCIMMSTLLTWDARTNHSLILNSDSPSKNTSTESVVPGAAHAKCTSIATITISAVLNVMRERREWIFCFENSNRRRLRFWHNPFQQKSKIQKYRWQPFARRSDVAFCRQSCFWRYWKSRHTSAELKARSRKSGRRSISKTRAIAPGPSRASTAGACSVCPTNSVLEFVIAILGSSKKQFKLSNTARQTIDMIAGSASLRRLWGTLKQLKCDGFSARHLSKLTNTASHVFVSRSTQLIG